MRNRYLDLLRAAAIARVIVYHLFGWPWLSILLPAMGIMFALAGSLTAASLDKRGADQVVISRLRRLLPPLWLLGLIAVPVMLATGWAQEHGDHPFSPASLGFWILPIGDPPGSDKGLDLWEPLWYIRAYLWFVVLSPIMYLAYKKVGWAAVAAPLVLIAVLDATGFTLPVTADAAMWDFATYGACWIAGFAHHDGRLARLKPAVVLAAAVVLGAAALYWLYGHPGEDGWDLNDVSEAQALWSLAFVLVALRWQPGMAWLGRVRPLDRAVTLLNGRAVTIYLWHNIAIAAVWPVLTVLTLDDLGRLNGPVDLISALALTAGAVLAFGWAEDLAARRRPRLWPSTDIPRPRSTTPPSDPPSPGPGTGTGAGTGPGPGTGMGAGMGAGAAPGAAGSATSLSAGGDDAGAPVTAATFGGGDQVAVEFAPPHRPGDYRALYSSAGTGSAPPPPGLMAERLHRQWQTDQQHMAEPFRGGSAPLPTSQHRPTGWPADQQGPSDHGPADHRPADHRPADHRPADHRPAEQGPADPGRAHQPLADPGLAGQEAADRDESPGRPRAEAAPPAQRHAGPAEPVWTESDQAQRRSDGGPVPRSRGETTAAPRAEAAAWFPGDRDSA